MLCNGFAKLEQKERNEGLHRQFVLFLKDPVNWSHGFKVTRSGNKVLYFCVNSRNS